jgi:TIR domain
VYYECPAFDVFVSYYEKTGRSYAETIRDIFEGKGLKTFVAHIERLKYSGNFRDKVNEAIRNCRYFVLLNTVDVFTRDEVVREIKTAYPHGLNNSHKLIVFRHSDYDVPRSDANFTAETGIDIGAENQHDFKDDADLASRVLMLWKHGLKVTTEVVEISTRKNLVNDRKLQEVSEADLNRQLNRAGSSNMDIQQSAWDRLADLALKIDVGKHNELWERLDQEILVDPPRPSTLGALIVLKIMLFKVKNQSGSPNYVTESAKQRYEQKLSDIMQSADSQWITHKSESKQIIDHITDEKQRFLIYWNSWKKLAVEIRNDNTFTEYTGYFINDLISAKEDYKTDIEPELDEMMNQSQSYIANRAHQLYKLLF